MCDPIAPAGGRYVQCMDWLELEHGDVDEYGSRGVRMSEAARMRDVDECAVHLAEIEPGGVLGRHPSRVWQLFCVMSGSGWVAGPDGARQDIEAGQAVLWSPGEEHGSGSDDGMTVVITQATVRLPYG
jgi:quercetin dioxygenase-like cupin family protein